MFKAAEIVGSVEAKNDALSAAVAMDTAERLYKHYPVERERRITTHAMSKQSKLNGNINGQIATEKCGRKRGIDKAFPEFNENETKMLSNRAIPI